MSAYYTLVTSLPWLPEKMQRCRDLPISRIALDRRLSLLADEDKQRLQWAEALYHRFASRISLQPDQDWVKEWQTLCLKIDSAPLHECILLRLEMQTLLAALRYRQRDRTQAEHFRGIGRWTQRIQQHWQEPLFGLEGAIPYLEEMGKLFQQGLSGDLQTFMDDYLWQDLLRVERSEHFTFETVACFVLRFGLAEQRLQSDADAALTYFATLSDDLMQHSGIERQLEQMFEDFS
ncbi:hypothetical protein [Nitrincola tapanii]|uniref:DUF2764 family protein n=1 Tax=Nitrincola tapanii TaxID=1708751 RepID=A0A5A9W6R9_9GAMM|nr:hypothetical protein [Nitrincola tapanii]KAA0876490.1 hypothetical protein E1H14_01840 [Nitrincola tapanii]